MARAGYPREGHQPPRRDPCPRGLGPQPGDVAGGVQTPSRGLEIWWRLLQMPWEAGIGCRQHQFFFCLLLTCLLSTEGAFLSTSWKTDVRLRSRDASALLKRFLYRGVAEIWAAIRSSRCAWCSAAWLILRSAFLPLLAVLWLLLGEDAEQAPRCCLQVAWQPSCRVRDESEIPVSQPIPFLTLDFFRSC